MQPNTSLKDALRYASASVEAQHEVLRARAKHAPMRGPHEGYAVLLEEVEELWAEVKAKTFDKAKARKEALQVAAMALAFVVEVCGEPTPSAPLRSAAEWSADEDRGAE